MIQLPTMADKLISTAHVYGWSYAVQWGQDTGSAVFVNIDAATADEHYRVTWNARKTGTLRVFSVMDWKRSRDMPSVQAVLSAISGAPQRWVLDATGGEGQ